MDRGGWLEASHLLLRSKDAPPAFPASREMNGKTSTGRLCATSYVHLPQSSHSCQSTCCANHPGPPAYSLLTQPWGSFLPPPNSWSLRLFERRRLKQQSFLFKLGIRSFRHDSESSFEMTFSPTSLVSSIVHPPSPPPVTCFYVHLTYDVLRCLILAFAWRRSLPSASSSIGHP